MVVLAESLNVKDTQQCSQRNNMLSGSESECFRIGYGMFATWVPLVQIETASIIGDDSGGSQSKNDP
eukprot:scaffold19497_cov58-Attheya_sp.AAC.3